jgi:hypothetical protein
MLIETQALGLPSKVVQFHNPGSQRLAGAAVNAFAVSVVAKLKGHVFEINGIPEQDLIEKILPVRPNEALNKGMDSET